MNKRNKRKSNLRVSLLLLLLASILLITSSYAWFTANKTVTVSTLDVNVAAQNGLQISTNGTTWKSIISKADITTGYSGAVNQLPEALAPVSTGKTIDSSTGFLDMFLGDIQSNDAGDYVLTATKSLEQNGVSGSFIAFDIFLKVAIDTDIEMTTSSKVITTDENSKGIENAARIAFVVEGNVANGTATTEIQGLKEATPGTTYIWEPNYNVHTPAAISHAFDTYGITTTADAATPLSCDGIIAEIPKTDNIKVGDATAAQNGLKFATVTSNYPTRSDYNANVQIFSLKAGITKVRMYMWIEGQDVDCQDDASGSNISFDLQLTVKENNG